LRQERTVKLLFIETPTGCLGTGNVENNHRTLKRTAARSGRVSTGDWPWPRYVTTDLCHWHNITPRRLL